MKRTGSAATLFTPPAALRDSRASIAQADGHKALRAARELSLIGFR